MFRSNEVKLLVDHLSCILNQVKPSSNQVNLASCCVMPPDLTAFAKEFDIQLLTHNDPKGEHSFYLAAIHPYLEPALKLSLKQTEKRGN